MTPVTSTSSITTLEVALGSNVTIADDSYCNEEDTTNMVIPHSPPGTHTSQLWCNLDGSCTSDTSSTTASSSSKTGSICDAESSSTRSSSSARSIYDENLPGSASTSSSSNAYSCSDRRFDGMESFHVGRSSDAANGGNNVMMELPHSANSGSFTATPSHDASGGTVHAKSTSPVKESTRRVSQRNDGDAAAEFMAVARGCVVALGNLEAALGGGKFGKDPAGLFNQGLRHEQHGDNSAALKLYDQAADQGHLKAMVNSAVLLLKRDGPNDYTRAREQLKVAGAHGVVRAQKWLDESLPPPSPKQSSVKNQSQSESQSSRVAVRLT